jgi:hypothetical protein
MACKVTVNGKVYSGENSIVIANRLVYIDGILFEVLDQSAGNIRVTGNSSVVSGNIVSYPEAPAYTNTVIANVISVLIVAGVVVSSFLVVLFLFSEVLYQ